MTDQVDGSDSVTMTYDALHRLKSASGLWGSYSYGYDPLNNIRSRSGPNALTYTYNATSNRLTGISGSQTRTYGYNAKGEITGDGTKTFTLNSLGQIQSITGIATYGYDGHGRRIKVTKSGATEYTLYDHAGRLVYTEQGTTRTDYLSVGGQTVVELKKTGTTTTPTYLHPDLLGSPRKATNQAKALLWSEHYDPYGLKLNGVNHKIGYTGHAHDPESGYTYMQARFYDPLVGRFLSADPIHFVDENPFTFNRYSYANNNPYRYTDPNGELVVLAIPVAVWVGNLATATVGATLGYAVFKDFVEPHLNETPDAPTNDDKVDALIKSGTKEGESSTKKISRPGGERARDKEFGDLGLKDIKDKGAGVKVGETDSGRRIVSRPSTEDGRPTIEVQRPDGKSSWKIRYDKNGE